MYRRRPGVDTPDKLVLTEAEYNSRTDDPYSFANASLLWAMREFNCIFIGCSMTDELMRRSLHRSFEEITTALQSEGKGPNEARKLARRHYAIIKAEHDENSNDLRKLDLSLLGVNTLWVKEWTEIPKRLQALSIGSWARSPVRPPSGPYLARGSKPDRGQDAKRDEN